MPTASEIILHEQHTLYRFGIHCFQKQHNVKTMTAATATIVTPANSRDLDGEYDTVDWLSKLESGAVLNASDCEKLLQDKVRRNMQTPSQLLAYG